MTALRALTVLARLDSKPVLLLGPDGRLPSARLSPPPGQTTLTAALRWLRSEGVEAAALELLFDEEPSQEAGPVPVLIVLEPVSGDSGRTPLPALGWHEVKLADRAVLVDGLTHVAAARAGTWLGEWLDGSEVPVRRARWARPGWYARAARWLEDRLRALGRAPDGPVEQVLQGGVSAILRADTAGGAVWLKSVFPLFHAEPAITASLSELAPDVLPAVVAIEPAEGWLVTEDLGNLIAASGHESASAAAVDALVAVQRASVRCLAPLRAAGAPRRPLDELPGTFARALANPPIRELELSHDALQPGPELATTVHEAVAALATLGLAETIVHGDFHEGNVAVVAGRPVIYDWSDAAISNPLVDLATWLARIESPVEREAVWTAVEQGWRDLLPRGLPVAIRRHALVAGAAYQVVSYDGILRALEPARRPEYAHGFTDFLAAVATPRDP